MICKPTMSISHSLPVLRSLGGCGGTLVTRVFAALPELVVLSETNPRLRGTLQCPAQSADTNSRMVSWPGRATDRFQRT